MSDDAELREVLLSHQLRYPRLQIQDLVKLVFQNEFAGGHMIADPQSSLERLREECRALADNQGDEEPGDVFVSIGNGLCRLQLAQLPHSGTRFRLICRRP